MEFNVSALVLENGVLISGTMKGKIYFSTVQLSNLALVIGIDLEGIPTLGIAATLDVSSFESALALFFDSATPANSLVAGALSNVSLRDIAQSLAGQTQLPSALETVLGLIALKALGTFSMPAAQAKALDQRDIATIASAFKQYGQISLAATSDQILLIINQQGASWHLTDLSTMKHYSLTLQGESISVVLQPQLYLAPQPTSIGSLAYPAGFTITAQIDYVLIHAQLNIQISPQQGILAEIDLAPIVFYNQTFFALTGANEQGGPRFSLATYNRPQIADPHLRDPHLLLSGSLLLLGANLAEIAMLVNEQGLNILVKSQVNPVLHVDLGGSIGLLGHFSLQGGVIVGIDRTLDLGERGSFSVNTSVQGQLSVAYDGSTSSMPTMGTMPVIGLSGRSIFQTLSGQPHVIARGNAPSADFSGKFVFQTISYTIPTLTLEVSGPALQNIAETLWQQISAIFLNLLKNPDQWLAWVHGGVISGVDTSAESIVKILYTVYQIPATKITTKMENIGYGAADIAKALLAEGVGAAGTVGQGAESTTNDVVGTLKDTATTGIGDLKQGVNDLKHLL